MTSDGLFVTGGMQSRCSCTLNVLISIIYYLYSDFCSFACVYFQEDLWNCIHKRIPVLLGQGKVKLVVIDSIAAIFRCEFGMSETYQRAKRLSSLAAQLLRLSSQYNIPVVCVNQVSIYCRTLLTHIVLIVVLSPVISLPLPSLSSSARVYVPHCMVLKHIISIRLPKLSCLYLLFSLEWPLHGTANK